MATVLYPNTGALEGIELLRTHLVNCEVKLFKNEIIPTPSTVVGDLVEADFGGYAPEVVAALLPAYFDPAGGASAQIATIQFQCSGAPPDNVVYGFWVENAGGEVILIGSFDQGVPMVGPNDALPLDIKFNFGN